MCSTVPHIYNVLTLAFYSTPKINPCINDHVHHSSYFSTWSLLHSTSSNYQSFVRSTASASSLPRTAKPLPRSDPLLQHLFLHSRQHRLLVSSLCSRTSMHIRTLCRGRARRSCQGADSIALAIRDERRRTHADRRFQQHQF